MFDSLVTYHFSTREVFLPDLDGSVPFSSSSSYEEVIDDEEEEEEDEKILIFFLTSRLCCACFFVPDELILLSIGSDFLGSDLYTNHSTK